ncbi:MAG: T9SS type A sorting domain-containing protein [Bacteroidales bacterium]|nr:T9SS type A sorting domain-containing protein [Bacteroidales bacterium]
MKKSIFLAASILLGLTLCIKSQTITIDSTFTSDAEIFPFNQNDTINGLRISGSVTLNSDTSLVRAIFTDDLYDEYMIWEAYPLIVSQKSFSFENVYDETYCLEKLDPYSIRIEIINASFTLESIYMLEEACNNAESDRYTAKRAMDGKKIDTLNLRIDEFGMDWTAGDGPLVDMYYSSKKTLYGERYNLLGFDFYKGGVFEFIGYRNYEKITGNLTPVFDWRSRHNANDSLSLYYDGDTLNTGWHTSVKDQDSCNYCWVFGPVGAIEAAANLYFNEMLDLDLSEEHVISCNNFPGGDCGGFGHPANTYSFIFDNGIIPEYCFPYQNADPSNCEDTCSSQHYRLSINDTVSVKILGNTSVLNDSIKKSIINLGPLSSIVKGNHVMVLSGWQDDFSDSTTVWIFKDSYGPSNANEHLWGFWKIKLPNNQMSRITGISTPVSLHDTSGITINCYDKDNDGYYWWGIGPKPDTCPTCPDQRDSNDNDPFFGPYDSCYNETCNYQYNTQAIHITSDTTWDSAMIVQNTIYVDSGYSLTIRSEVKFVEHSGIIVKQGGKLNIYGGKLTKACHELWKGIEVWGHYDTTQYFPGIQGIIKIDSNSLIEFAEIGLTAGCRDIDPQEMYPYLRAGGIIIAKNSKFLNNTIDVEFQPYHNIHPYNPKQELSNASHFYNCVFETNNNDCYYYPPDKHLVLNEVKDIDILGCTFKGTHPDSLNAEADRYRGYGIYSTGSSFFVDNYCWSQAYPCPDSCKITSSFKNLNYGIYALEWNTSRLIKIDSAEFSNNICGAYFSGLSNPSFTFNSLDISPRLIEENDTICGLYLDACTGYFVEENTFSSKFGILPGFDSYNYIGLYIKNSGSANNEIYNNYFNNNYYATIVEGVNRGDTTGLCIRCNDYRYNLNDIFVVPDTSIRNLRLEQGIAEYQGSVSDTTTTGPAGNTFTVFEDDPDTVKIKYYNYLNDTTEYFNYLHHNYNWQTPPRIYPINVNDSTELIIFHYMNENYIKSISCPSSFDQGGIESLKSTMVSEQNQIETLETDIESSVDGGSTPSLLNEIQNSNPSQGNALRQQLMDYSPYLSDTVVAASIEKENVLPNPYIRDIMLANPHSSKKEKLVDKIDKRNNPMPGYMKQEIKNAKYSLDALDLLLSGKRTRENKKDKLLNNITRLYLTDTTITNPTDSVKVLLENEQTFNRKIELAYLSLQQNDSTEARNIIDNIANTFNLSPMQDTVLNYYDKLIEVLIGQKSNKKADISFDSLTALDLMQIYFKKLPGISNYAGNLLQAAGKLNRKERYYFPANLNRKSVKKIPSPIGSKQEKLNFKLIPNPAKDMVTVDYENHSIKGTGVSEIHNMTGQKVKSIELKRDKDQFVLDIANWPSGLYVIRLSFGEMSHSKKLVVLK